MMMIQLVSLHNEFMVRIETPQSMDQVEHDQLHSDGYTRGDYQSMDSQPQLSAVNLRVEVSLVGLMENGPDGKQITLCLHVDDILTISATQKNLDLFHEYLTSVYLTRGTREWSIA